MHDFTFMESMLPNISKVVVSSNCRNASDISLNLAPNISLLRYALASSKLLIP